MRHALRLMVVGALDVVAMRLIRVNHGFWLPMTSIILMQPYSARARIGRACSGFHGHDCGWIAGGGAGGGAAGARCDPGGDCAAGRGLTLATFSVDYAVYSFFLTPTFVLMSLPHPHDWRYAGVRMGLTLAGAAIAILAMRLLWPERAEAELAALLQRGAAAEAAYLRAVAAFLRVEGAGRRAAERTLLAPARRACGLASNDAEEALDRVLQEPLRGAVGDVAERALTFTTYMRRLTQSATTLAAQGSAGVAGRLESLAGRLENGGGAESSGDETLERIERQTGVLVRTLGEFGAKRA